MMDKDKIYFKIYDCCHTYGLHIIADNNSEIRTKLRNCFHSHTVFNRSTMQEKTNNPAGMFLQSDCDDYMFIEFLLYGEDQEDKALQFAEEICDEIGEKLFL